MRGNEDLHLCHPCLSSFHLSSFSLSSFSLSSFHLSSFLFVKFPICQVSFCQVSYLSSFLFVKFFFVKILLSSFVCQISFCQVSGHLEDTHTNISQVSCRLRERFAKPSSSTGRGVLPVHEMRDVTVKNEYFFIRLPGVWKAAVGLS